MSNGLWKIAMELHVVAKYKMPEKRIQVFSEIIYMQSIYLQFFYKHYCQKLCFHRVVLHTASVLVP